MNNIVMGRSSEGVFSSATLNKLFRFRHEVFFQRLGWEVQTQADMERDHYDDLDPVYIVARSPRGEVDGCWRILPTTGPYMLRDTFPELLRGEAAPSQEDVWELSRFAVRPDDPADRAQADFSARTMELIRIAYVFAHRNGVREYVTVMSAAMERLLQRIGIPTVRLGDGKAVRIGRVLSVACRISLDIDEIANEDTRRFIRIMIPATADTRAA